MIKNTSLKKSLHVLFALAIGAGIIWLSVRQLTPKDKEEIQTAFQQANYWWVALSLVLAFISNISRTIRWQMLLKPMGYRPKFGNVMMSILVAYFANLGLPRLGEVVRCGLLRTHEKVPFEKSLGTVVTERFLDLMVFTGLFVLNFFLQFNKIHTYVEQEIFSKFNFSLSGTLLVLGGLFGVSVALLYIFRKNLAQLPLYQKIKHLIEGFWSGIKSITKVDKPLLFIFHSLFIWFCYWLMAYLVFQSLPITQNLGALASLTALAIGTIGMIVVQGGLGIYPLLIAGSLVAYNVSYPLGYAMGWLMWGSQTIGIITAGTIALILIPILNKTKEQS
ncbi:MAG: lysylphosphatidylglycerol synthase transmembrane domain-containing protein [Bacteroidales bacterium]|jgi:uncharacterized protein (TIRG00374 family)|nr:lysylphosphatidylglycerol synthase transmembrane domain-containing protein [Bacteroidales bacterium]